MFKNKKVRWLFIIIVAIFSVTFALDIFLNPNFNIYDLCLNLSSEILGIVILLVLVDAYVKERNKNE